MSINKVILIGHVGADPTIRSIDAGNGTSVKAASLRIATTEKFRTRNGEVKENTEWHNISAWRQLAQIIEKYVKKGSHIYVEGKLRTRKYTDANGVEKYVTEVEAQSLQLLDRKPQQEQAAASAPQAPAYEPAPEDMPEAVYAPMPGMDAVEEDLP